MRLAILDDHFAVGAGLGLLLTPQFEVVAVLHDWMTLHPFLRSHIVDITLVDGSLPRCDISELIRDAEKLTRVIVMTSYPRSSIWPGVRRMGASGVVAKSLAPDEFIAQVERLAGLEGVPSDGERATQTPEPTSRQHEVLIGMAAGLQTKEIAASCNLGVSRTSELIAEVLHLTKTRNWAAAVLAAVEEGWIEPHVPALSSPSPIISESHEVSQSQGREGLSRTHIGGRRWRKRR